MPVRRTEIALFVGSLVFSISVAALVLKWLAPEFFGGPRDLTVVQSTAELPPFFEGVFRAEDFRTSQFLLNDPVTVVRLRPLLPEGLGVGPHDLLGFRNRSVPASAAVIVVGDSQTYSNNVLFHQSWPQVTARHPTVAALGPLYSMAAGSWGGVQYIDLITKCLVLYPRAVVLAIYTGNDALETFRVAYSVDSWSKLRIDPNLSIADLPVTKFPPPVDEHWSAQLAGGDIVTFTPTLRFESNDPAVPAVRVGWQLIGRVVQTATSIVNQAGAKLFVTIIPTKEYVYLPALKGNAIKLPKDYARLIEVETNWIAQLTKAIERSGSAYIDVIKPLQKAASTVPGLYPPDANGHPLAPGYEVIGKEVAAALASKLQLLSEGLYHVDINPERSMWFLWRGGQLYRFSSRESVAAHGWSLEDSRLANLSDLVHFPIARELTEFRVDPRFKPDSEGGE